LLEPGWYESSYDAGSTHGTWHPYDTHIPLLFYGCGVKIGKTKQPYTISDIVPTLATYLGIALPNACIGQPIIGVFE
jgi:arylsulfatase A-like enzyme